MTYKQRYVSNLKLLTLNNIKEVYEFLNEVGGDIDIENSGWKNKLNWYIKKNDGTLLNKIGTPTKSKMFFKALETEFGLDLQLGRCKMRGGRIFILFNSEPNWIEIEVDVDDLVTNEFTEEVEDIEQEGQEESQDTEEVPPSGDEEVPQSTATAEVEGETEEVVAKEPLPEGLEVPDWASVRTTKGWSKAKVYDLASSLSIELGDGTFKEIREELIKCFKEKYG